MPINWTEIGEEHREYNRLNLAIILRQLRGEITDQQAKEEMKLLHSMYPQFSNKPTQPPLQKRFEDEYTKDDPWEDIGYRRKRAAKGDPIPAAAKSAMKHRSACGVKLSDNDLSRFWSKIKVGNPNDCWPWKNSLRGSLGYGQFRIGDRICDAHRISLELAKGPLPKGRYVCHSCDNPKCCNPGHLFAGTQKNNVDDMTQKGRGDN